MAGSINQVTIVGRLAADPEVKQFPDNTKCNFSVATNRTYTRRDGVEVNQAEFHRVVTSGNIARVAERYLSKGKQVGIIGRLATRSWEDNAGNKKYITEIFAERLHLLGSPSSAQDTAGIPRNDMTNSATSPSTPAGKPQDVKSDPNTAFGNGTTSPPMPPAADTPQADDLPF